jgi:hypothetical protein
VDNDDGPQTTSDWRERQPYDIEECHYLVRCSDLLVRDGIGDDAKAVLRAIIDEPAED